MNYHNITKDDMLNGDGLRAVLWVAGCNHACNECQNPITWDPDGGLLFDDSAKKELFEILDRDYISGVTFSGGDPLFPGNREEITKLAKEIKDKYPTKTLWLYTGYLFDEIKDLEVVKYLDVIVDGPFMIDKKNNQAKWKGSDNQRVIDVKRTISEGGIHEHTT